MPTNNLETTEPALPGHVASTERVGLAVQDLTGDVAWLWTHCRALGMARRSHSGLMRDDVALYVVDLNAALDGMVLLLDTLRTDRDGRP